MLNVRGEKVSEAMFLGALKKAVAQWPGAQLVDYCCAESGILGKDKRVVTPEGRGGGVSQVTLAVTGFIGSAGDSIGGSDPHYQVFVEVKGVRNLTEEQRYKVRRPHPLSSAGSPTAPCH